MNKNVFLFLLLASFSSCNNSKNNCSELKSENLTLRLKVDSLERLNKDLITQLQNSQTKIGKKANNKRPIKESSFSTPKKKSYSSTNNSSTTKSTSLYSSPKQNKPSAYSGQCRAITKKGTRCSRKARSGGYCWQHGG